MATYKKTAKTTKAKTQAKVKAVAAAPEKVIKAAPPEPVAEAVTASGRTRGDEVQLPTIATMIYVLCFSSGPRGAQDMLPLHELILCKRKLEAHGESLTLLVDYPVDASRERPLTSLALKAMHERFAGKYIFKAADDRPIDLVMDVYGPPSAGRMLKIIRQQHKAYLALVQAGKPLTREDIEQLALMADPDAEIEAADYEMAQ